MTISPSQEATDSQSHPAENDYWRLDDIRSCHLSQINIRAYTSHSRLNPMPTISWFPNGRPVMFRHRLRMHSRVPASCVTVRFSRRFTAVQESVQLSGCLAFAHVSVQHWVEVVATALSFSWVLLVKKDRNLSASTLGAISSWRAWVMFARPAQSGQSVMLGGVP